ncbi:MAG TPA: hypothetical protein VNW30_05045 [Opitutaceae bacterium]|jgi:hypothetical protein|nr:hypothetical protein [Opitutaceae bacterium]
MTAIKRPNLVRKHPVALVCSLLCVGLALAIYFRKDAQVQALAELDDKISQGNHLKENVDNANSLNKADRLDEQYAVLTQVIQSIEARLVHADQLAINLQYFYKLESETQTKLTNLSQTGVVVSGKNTGKTSYVRVGYAIGVQGTYPQLLDFVRRVENGDHFSRVVGMVLSSAGDDESAPKNTGTISLNLNLELLGLP